MSVRTPASRWVALIATTLVITGSVGGCARSSSATSASTPSSQRAASCSPAAIDLTLPTTIHAGTGVTGGAALSLPSSPAMMSCSRAVAVSGVDPQGQLSGQVLADVSMPNDRYRGERIDGLTCWVYVFTLPQAIDPRLGGPYSATPRPRPSPMLVQHLIVIIDAGNGQFVRGYFTR